MLYISCVGIILWAEANHSVLSLTSSSTVVYRVAHLDSTEFGSLPEEVYIYV